MEKPKPQQWGMEVNIEVFTISKIFGINAK